MMSRCSSPIPEMTVCPVSSSNRTTNVGSSSASFASPAPSLSWSAFVLGSTATEMTGVGKLIDSSTTWSSGSQIVSPVVACFRPTTATMSPVYAAALSSRWFACICRMRPMRSLRSFVEFITCEPLWSTPE